MVHPRSIRLESAVEAQLASYVARHPGLSASSVAARLVDEGLRMDQHPAIYFREGPAGRRATIVGGPDVWEIVRAVLSARSAEPELEGPGLISLVSQNSGLPVTVIRSALDYRSAYPAEVDAMIEYAATRESRAVAEQSRGLLAG